MVRAALDALQSDSALPRAGMWFGSATNNQEAAKSSKILRLPLVIVSSGVGPALPVGAAKERPDLGSLRLPLR